MFQVNKRYCFRDDEVEEYFVDNSPLTNGAIAKMIDRDGFITIAEVQGSVAFVQNDDEQLVLNDDEFMFFVEVDTIQNRWKVGHWYYINNLPGLLSESAINNAFARECALNKFKVLKVKDGNCRQLMWEDNGSQSMYHVFTQHELKYFNCIGVDPNAIVVDPTPQEISPKVEEPAKPLCELEGIMVIRVEDEADRLRAIEFLQNSKWKS